MRRSSLPKAAAASVTLAVILTGRAGGGEDNRSSSSSGFSVAVGDPDHLTLFYGTYVYATTERVSGVVISPADLDLDLELDRIRVTG